jgi:predicted site-specific integrase-resolvase
MSNDSKQRHNLERRFTQVKQILTDVQLVIADSEVLLNGELRSSPTLCALIPAANGHDEKIIPLNTPDGRPIFMNPENAIAPTQA